ncbi:MAG TPA: hypothetical protein VG754_10705 [Verrucomicrobiae bacterium]|nr:hypothetical protein [Verrucomicrobiae bacterium]
MPAKVQHTILAYGGSAEIKDINTVGEDEDVYKVQFTNPGVTPTLFVSEDGTPLNAAPTNSVPWVEPPPVPSTLDQRKTSL